MIPVEQLIKARKEIGLSGELLAEYLGIHPKTLYAWEVNGLPRNVGYVLLYLRVLGIPLDEILPEPDEETLQKLRAEIERNSNILMSIEGSGK